MRPDQDKASVVKIVYDDFGGAHSTQVAAAIHLGRLPAERVATPAELLALPLFDRPTRRHHGCLILMGRDAQGHDVYVLGRGTGAEIVERAVASGLALAGGDAVILRFFNTLPHVNLWMRVGGFLSRSLGWIGLGRPLVVYGTRRAYPALAKVVAEAQRWSATVASRLAVTGSDGADLYPLVDACAARGVVPGIAPVAVGAPTGPTPEQE